MTDTFNHIKTDKTLITLSKIRFQWHVETPIFWLFFDDYSTSIQGPVTNWYLKGIWWVFDWFHAHQSTWEKTPIKYPLVTFAWIDVEEWSNNSQKISVSICLWNRKFDKVVGAFASLDWRRRCRDGHKGHPYIELEKVINKKLTTLIISQVRT